MNRSIFTSAPSPRPRGRLRLQVDKKRSLNLINPGPGHTAHLPNLKTALDYARHGEAWQARERATPQDIADAVLYLCREEARFVTGSHVAFSIT